MFAGRWMKWIAAGCCLALLAGCGTGREEDAASREGKPVAEQTLPGEEGRERLPEPSSAESVQAESSSSESFQAESASSDVSQAESSSLESFQTELSSSESFQTESASSDMSQAEPSSSEPFQAESASSDVSQAEPSSSESSQGELSSPEPSTSELPVLPPLQVQPPLTGGHIIAIDAGHQARGNKEKEPLGPGSEEMKAKVSSGTRGVSTGVYEYELNLTIAQALQAELEARGYTVVMIRDSHDVDISNKERAETANASGAEVFLRIHANGSEKSSVQGTLTICNTASSPFNPGIHDESYRLSQEVLSHMVALMGSKDRGIWETDTMSGINWCTIPVTIIEMGYMSNAEEDERMQTADYQSLIVQGIADGVDAYFTEADSSLD